MLDEMIFAGSRLCVVGNICRDVKIAPLKPDTRLLQDGETPTKGIIESVGGGGANSALFAACLGAKVSFAGKIGDDPLGTALHEVLLRSGIQPLLRRDPATPTGNSVVLSYTNGSRHFISHQPNNDTLSYSDIDPVLLTGGGHLLRADVWFSSPMLAGGNALLLQAARRQGMATSLDLNWDPCWGSAPEDQVRMRKALVRDILPWVDLVHGNVRELNYFADSPDLTETLHRLTGLGAGAVVVHMGDQGAGYYRDGALIVEPAAPVERHVNVAGSGDLLSVCLILLHGRDDITVRERLRLANGIVAEYIEGKRASLPQIQAPRS